MNLESLIETQTQLVEDEVSSKCCSGCKTTTTPLWRTGPTGPKSLCNACGIKYHKKRRAQMSEFVKSTRKLSSSSFKISKQSGDLKLKVRLMVFKQNKRKNKKQHKQQQQQEQCKRKRSLYERGKPWWNNLREEEQAAILLTSSIARALHG